MMYDPRLDPCQYWSQNNRHLWVSAHYKAVATKDGEETFVRVQSFELYSILMHMIVKSCMRMSFKVF
jgi:hypothetical protein